MPNQQEQRVGLGRRMVDTVNQNATPLAAVALVGVGVATIAYVGGKAALTTAGIIGGGIFAVVFGYEVAKAAVGTANEVGHIAAQKVADSFAPPRGTLHTETEVRTTRRTHRAQRGGQRAAAAT